ncbi:MAG TPA: hypothetical protein VGZ02_14820 [Candidatus Baltobacteraceae bacterium]|jgi:hypothetical protein|nr:hypothetical protein [Candidatus Baltobacteraceae bacterium]
MAIRPVDLQLAYLAGPQNAANVSHAQNAPQAAQQAAQSAFAAEVVKREESIAQPEKVEGQKVRPRDERDPSERRQHQGRHRHEQAPRPDSAAPLPPADGGADAGHLIDFTA